VHKLRHEQERAEEPHLKLQHAPPRATKKLMEKEHLSSESSRRLPLAMTEAAESSRRLQLTVRLRTAPFPARILPRMAFDGAKSCGGRPDDRPKRSETPEEGLVEE